MIECDGKAVFEKNEVLNIEPHESAELKLEIQKCDNLKWGCYLNVYLIKDDVVWGKKQHLIEKAESKKCNRNPAVLTEDRERIYIEGDNYSYVFNKRYGNFEKIILNGKVQCDSLMKLTVWRAYTDNDAYDVKNWKQMQEGLAENFNILCNKVYSCEFSGNKIIVKASLSGLARTPFLRYTQTCEFFDDGSVDVTLSGDIRKLTTYLPRLGFEIEMPADNNEFEYFGRGDGENYCDMKSHTAVGYFRSNAEKEYVNYIRPQEHGNHTETRYIKFKNGITFSSDNDFEFKVSEYSSKALTDAEHINELIKNGKTNVRIDYKVSGIGSHSCGPALAEKYRLNDDNSFEFKFTIGLD